MHPRKHYLNLMVLGLEMRSIQKLNYGLYIGNMFPLEEFTDNFINILSMSYTQPIPTRLNKDALMPKYNQMIPHFEKERNLCLLIWHNWKQDVKHVKENVAILMQNQSL